MSRPGGYAVCAVQWGARTERHRGGIAGFRHSPAGDQCECSRSADSSKGELALGFARFGVLFPNTMLITLGLALYNESPFTGA